MRVVVWMVLACTASCALIAARSAAPQALWIGMIGPLLSAATSWILMERAARLRPSTLSGLMMTAFVVKMLFFAAYVIVALAVLRVPAAPFAIAFTCYFVSLHLTEALLLKRLFVPEQPALRR
jgi:hypothetical protein